MIANWSFLTRHTHTHTAPGQQFFFVLPTFVLPTTSSHMEKTSLPPSLALSPSPRFFWSDYDRETSGRSSSFLCLCFFAEIKPSDNLSPSSLKELNKHRPLPVVPMNFLSGRQETIAGATGSKLPAAQCVPRVRVRSGVGPITFFPGSP